MTDQISREDFFAGCALVGLLSFLGNRGLGVQDETVVEHAVQLASLLVDELDMPHIQAVANFFEKLDQNSPPQDADIVRVKRLQP